MATHGEYIVERLFPEFIRAACREQGIALAGFSDNWVLRLERDNQRRWIVGYTFSLNNAAATELANDKVAAYQALAAANLPAVEHYLARSRAFHGVLTDNLASIPAEQPVLTKLLQGASGQGVHLFPNVKAAVNFLAGQDHPDWTLSPWYDIVDETRFIICDGEIMCCYEKQGATSRDEDGLKLYNLSKGARAVEVTPDPAKAELALNAVKAFDLRLAAVDIVTLIDGNVRILEVNAGIMMENYARQSDEYKNRAQDVYRAIVEKMFA